uniref:Lamin n=1 Tax=Panagrolaimus sp. ES5 TaxID=591445 RepID=A0AC34GX78_9BILA
MSSSTRSKRTSTASTTRIVRDNNETYSFTDDSIENGRSSSPNPQQWTRLQEKQQLSNLNDRLATYIDKVRSLEAENARLHVQIKDVEIIEKKEKENLADRYENKIAELRRLVDALSRDKAKIELEGSGATTKYNDLKQKYDKVDRDFKRVEKERNSFQSLLSDLQSRSNDNEARRRSAEARLAELEKELDALQQKVDSLTNQLEDEVLLRAELQNQLASAKEDLEFARASHNNQMEDFRRKRQVEMVTVSTEIEKNYQAKLQEQLQAMRADFDARIAASRKETADMYQNKLSEALETSDRARRDAAQAREDYNSYRLRTQGLEKEQAELEKKLELAQRRIKDLETQLRIIEDDYANRIQLRDDRIAILERQINDMLSQYQDLLDLKIQLDTELQAYQKLLEGEETRLHITPTTTPNTSTNLSSSMLNTSSSGPTHHVSFQEVLNSSNSMSPRRGVKRRRLEQDDLVRYDRSSRTFNTVGHSDTDVEIDEVDSEGRFVKIVNKSEEDFNLGKWSIKSVGDAREVTFQFHTRQLIKPGQIITIWSCDSGETHSPPNNLVMKKQSWPTGDSVRVDLMNEEGTIVAHRQMFLESGFRDHLDSTDPDQRCSIM